MDYSHKQTEKMLKELEKEIEAGYNKAIKTMKKEMQKLLERVKFEENPQRAYAQLQRLKRIDALIKQMTNDLANANKIATQIMNDELIDVYEVNYNYSAYSIEKLLVSDLNFTVMNKQVIKSILADETNPFALLAIDELKDKVSIHKALKRELFTGILAGESINKIAQRIGKIVEADKNRALKIARTETTRVQNAARFDTMKHAEKQGLKILKSWVATGDARTRKSHLAINGETVPLHEEFSNGLQFPADTGGHASEVINCRCTMITEFADLEKTKEELELDEALKYMEFEEWLNRENNN